MYNFSKTIFSPIIDIFILIFLFPDLQKIIMENGLTPQIVTFKQELTMNCTLIYKYLDDCTRTTKYIFFLNQQFSHQLNHENIKSVHLSSFKIYAHILIFIIEMKIILLLSFQNFQIDCFCLFKYNITSFQATFSFNNTHY